MNLRADLALIADLVNPGARVLDLGCGEGDLLATCRNTRTSTATAGRRPENIRICVSKGVNVIEQDLDDGLDNFESKASTWW